MELGNLIWRPLLAGCGNKEKGERPLQKFNFNSIQFILCHPISQNYKFALKGFTICTHTTSLTVDLTLDQEQLPKNPFTGKKGKKPSGEQKRRIPLQDGQVQWMSCDQKQSKIVFL